MGRNLERRASGACVVGQSGGTCCSSLGDRLRASITAAVYQFESRQAVNSPALSATVFFTPPEKTGCSFFAAVYRRVRDFYLWGAGRDLRVSFGGAVVFSAD